MLSNDHDGGGMPFQESVFLSQKRDRDDPTGNWEMFCTMQPRYLCPATSSLNTPRNAKGYGRKKALSAAAKAVGCELGWQLTPPGMKLLRPTQLHGSDQLQ